MRPRTRRLWRSGRGANEHELLVTKAALPGFGNSPTKLRSRSTRLKNTDLPWPTTCRSVSIARTFPPRHNNVQAHAALQHCQRRHHWQYPLHNAAAHPRALPARLVASISALARPTARCMCRGHCMPRPLHASVTTSLSSAASPPLVPPCAAPAWRRLPCASPPWRRCWTRCGRGQRGSPGRGGRCRPHTRWQTPLPTAG